MVLSCWAPPPVACQFGTVARVRESWVEWVGDLGWPPCVESQVLAFGRATSPTLIESFFVVRRNLGVAALFPEGSVRGARRPSRPTRLGSALVSSAHSRRLTSCVQSSCAALAVPTSCVVSKKRSASSHQATSFFLQEEKLATLVPFAARSRLLAPRLLCTPFSCVTRFLEERDTLLPCWLSWRQCSCVLQGLVQMTTLFAVW